MREYESDTVVVASNEEGFQRVFLGENRWWAVRIAAARIAHLKYVAIYRTAPVCSITHYARIRSIECWEGSKKYVINFVGKAMEVGPLRKSKGSESPVQSWRYTSIEKLRRASNLDEAF
jgi:hypothetical protein